MKALLVCVLLIPCSLMAQEKLVVNSHSEVPALAKWAEDAETLIREWHPRISNLLPTTGFKVQHEIHFKLKKSDKGVGATSGNRISVSSSWIEKHPKDTGLVIHELSHVIQAYPSAEPWWVTEGVADYIRWAIYEGKPQSWFPRPKKAEGYKAGYNPTAGFFLWLETGHAPGIVNTLNSAMRKREYSEDLFKQASGLTLDELWAAYTK